MAKTLRSSAGRVVINDSKKLHQKKSGYRHLQRGVLVFLAAASEKKNSKPLTIGDLLKCLGAADFTGGQDYPWYRDLPDRPLHIDGDDIATCSTALSRDLGDRRIRFEGLSSQALPAGRFNQMVQAANNKASVLFSLICRLISAAYRDYGRQNLQICIDKQGGRAYYRRPLQTMFPDFQLKIIRETERISSYALHHAAGSLKIHFLEKGEQRQLPIALASMTSKYLRELFMESLNAYFRRLIPDLRPTAGYYQDGQRFLADLEGRIAPEDIRGDLLIRQR
ncbi:MAG: hypothetical protein JW810_03690 [Sedimentisphaerales bacterium]|nr:hypothetical protein [Sedimentisphaerales bacterium]